MKTQRVILDTNVYEKLYEKEFEKILKLIKSNQILVYGCKIIRDELREIPKLIKKDGKNFRNSLLTVYDKLAGKHSYPTEKVIETLAEEYWKEYKSNKGGTSKRKIFPDFLIVAIATIHWLDIVVSEDNKTMKSRNALKSYNKINKENRFNTPKFISINELIKL